MKIGRLVVVVLVAMILSAPATGAVSEDGQYGDALALAKEQLSRVATQLS